VRRDRGKWVAGVATGMSDSFGIDVTVVRVLWVIVVLASFGVGVAAYALFWFAFPSEYHPAPISRFGHMRDWSKGYVVGMVLLGIGLVIVLGNLLALQPYHHFGAFAWATLLIGGGAAVLLLRNPDEHDDDGPAPATSTPPPDDAVTEPGTEPARATDAAPPTPTFALPPVPPPPTTSAWTQHAPWPAEPPSPPRVRRPRPRPFLTPLTISLLLIGGGAAALVDGAGWVHFTVAGVLASGLVLVGAVLVLSAWRGRAHGLIPIGLLLLLATIPAVTIDVPITGGMGERIYQPTTRAELQRTYELGIGHLKIDLRDAPLTDQVTHIDGRLGIGNLEVEVPSNVRVDVQTHNGAGSADLFGKIDGGWPHHAHAVAGVAQPGVLYLDLRVGAGAVNVERWSSDGSLVNQ
jgi:phage shock protein PspC (stress-responsive transcriptional regulator)